MKNNLESSSDDEGRIIRLAKQHKSLASIAEGIGQAPGRQLFDGVDVQGDTRNLILTKFREMGLRWPDCPAGIVEVTFDDEERFGPMAPRMLLTRDTVPLEEPIFFGGICCFYGGDLPVLEAAIAEGAITNEEEFGRWYLASGYPRMDMIDGTLALPPESCNEVVYVVEDSTWALRIARLFKRQGITMQVDSLASVFRETHEKVGESAVENHIRSKGYKGDIRVVYTSDHTQAYDGLIDKINKRKTSTRKPNGKMGRKLRPQDVGNGYVAALYDQAFPEAIGLDPERVMVAEPFNNILFKGALGRPIKHIAGFLPHWSDKGPVREQISGTTNVPHRNDRAKFGRASEGDITVWDCINYDLPIEMLDKLGPDGVRDWIAARMNKIYGVISEGALLQNSRHHASKKKIRRFSQMEKWGDRTPRTWPSGYRVRGWGFERVI